MSIYIYTYLCRRKERETEKCIHIHQFCHHSLQEIVNSGLSLAATEREELHAVCAWVREVFSVRLGWGSVQSAAPSSSIQLKLGLSKFHCACLLPTHDCRLA